MKFNQEGIKADQASGVPQALVDEYKTIAKNNKTILLFRLVNPFSTGLISEGSSTKNLQVHAKSADWGPQSGYIPADPSLSKLWDGITAVFEKAKADVSHSLELGYTSPQLKLSEQRFQFLLQSRLISTIKPDGTFSVFGKGEGAFEFRAVAEGSHYAISYRRPGESAYTALRILADRKGSPLTADIDMFAIVPHLSNFADPVSSGATVVEAGQKKSSVMWSKAVEGALRSLGAAERRTTHDMLGTISDFELNIRYLMNDAALSLGMKEVVNHGTEQDNPYPEKDEFIYGIDPGGASFIATRAQLKDYIAEQRREGFVFHENRKYSATALQIIQDAATDQSKLITSQVVPKMQARRLASYLNELKAVFSPSGTFPDRKSLDRGPVGRLSERFEVIGEVHDLLSKHLLESGVTPAANAGRLTRSELDALNLGGLEKALVERVSAMPLPAGTTLTQSQIARIANLAVDGIIRQNFRKLTELMTYLGSLDFPFESGMNTDLLLASGGAVNAQYQAALNERMAAEGKPLVATPNDMAAIGFVQKIAESLTQAVNAPASATNEAIKKATSQGHRDMEGYLRSVSATFAADAYGTVYVAPDAGGKFDGTFWNADLPMLRALQKSGLIGDIRVLHEPADTYHGKQLKDVGSLLTAQDTELQVNSRSLVEPVYLEVLAGMHKRWVQGEPMADLISLHGEVKGYIDLNPKSARNKALHLLLEQTGNKLLELDAMDRMDAGSRVKAAKANRLGESQIWSREQLTAHTAVFGKTREESYLRILSLLDAWQGHRQSDSFPIQADKNGEFVAYLPFKGDVIDQYSNQIASKPAFEMLRGMWSDIEVINDAAAGKATFKFKTGAQTEITFSPANTLAQAFAQQKQLANLQIILFMSFKSETMPAQIAIQGDQITASKNIGDTPTVISKAQNDGSWSTPTSEALLAVRRDAPASSTPVVSSRYVDRWATPVVQGNPEGSDSQYAAQIIVQTQNDEPVARAAVRLAGKHPDSSLVIQLDADGNMRLVYGDPAIFQKLGAIDRVRWQIVGHGEGPVGARTLGDLDAAQWSQHIRRFQQSLYDEYSISSVPARISLVGCAVEDADLLGGFGHKLVEALQIPGLEISARSANVVVQANGIKTTRDANDELRHKDPRHKVVLEWSQDQGVTEVFEALPSRALLGRDGIDVGALLDDLRLGRVALEQLGAAQNYVLTLLFPGDNDELDQAQLRSVLEDASTFKILQDLLARMFKNPGSKVDPASVDAADLVRQAFDINGQINAGSASARGDLGGRAGSIDIRQFAANPALFAKTHALSVETLVSAGRLPDQAFAKLIKMNAGVYEVEYTATSGPDTVPAYFLGYNGPNQGNASPAYIDIPKQAAAGSFLFTGTLSGCSLVVTSLDANTFRVYHDGRVNSSVLYDNVVMSVDWNDYRIGATAEGIAAAYLQFVDGQWQLAVQRQAYHGTDRALSPTLRVMEEPLSIQHADSQIGPRKLAEFTDYREQVHQRLKKLAGQFAVSADGVTDGVYSGGAFSYDHPAIAAWTALRREVNRKYLLEIDQLKAQRDELYKQRSTASRPQLIDQQIKQNLLTHEYYKAQFDTVLRESGSVDRSWLWTQIKAKEGMPGVLRFDDTDLRGGDQDATSSLGERYANVEAYQRGALDVEFMQGLRAFRDISIPGVTQKMSALDLKQLFLEGQLTAQQRGALSARIEEISQAENIEKILKRAALLSEGLKHAGSTFSQLAPQDFFLSLVGDGFGGRCYPLVRAMAVALADAGSTGINSLVQKLFLAAAEPQAGSSTLLKNSLVRLHSNGDTVQASTTIGKLNLADVVGRLKGATGTSTFALNTRNHSMLVASTVMAKGRRYYFYDPNVGIFAYDDTASFLKAMEQHLVGRGLADFYGAFGSKQSPEFNLVQIDADKMAKVQVGNGLEVADLSRPGELATLIDQRRQVQETVSVQSRIAEDMQLRGSLVTLDVEQWGARFAESSTRLATENGLDPRWMPVIATTEDQGAGNYRVQFINRDQPEQSRWLNTRDSNFTEFRRFIDVHTATLGKHFTLERGQMRPRGSVAEAGSIDGLNAGFALQTLIQWFADKQRDASARGVDSTDLATALKIHGYLNMVQMGHGVLQDVGKVTALVRTALRGEVVAGEATLKDFASTLGHTVSEGAGVIFGGGMVILDAYELAHAENETQKAVFGTQLTFDSASFITGAAGVGAGMLGATTAGALLGGAGVIVGGLAVGFTALAQAFGPVAEDAKAVGRYFNTVDDAYKGHGYRYDQAHKVLVPLPGAVVKTLDLQRNQISFDSQYIYRTHSGPSGSGEINYFVWAGDYPVMVRDRNQAIEIRSGIGYRDATYTLDHGESNVVILPSTPKSYISYEYEQLPFVTARHDAGFDVIRRLERDKRFDYDFYIFPAERTIRKISQEYVATSVEVKLDQRNRQLIVPELPKELHGFMSYEIKGAGGEYLVSLKEGAWLKLTSETPAFDPNIKVEIHQLDSTVGGGVPYSLVGNTPSRWIIDTSRLAGGNIQVLRDRLVIGGVSVLLDPATNGRILLVNGKGEVREVDFTDLSARVVSEDASKWQAPGQGIEKHLKDLASAHQLHGQYVVVENYQHNGRNLGRAYYDVAKDRMMFTDTSEVKAGKAQLGAVIGDYAYFHDDENAAAWRVDIASGKVDAQYTPWFNDSVGKISRLWAEGGEVYLARRYQMKDGQGELSYRLVGDRMELVSAVGDDALLKLLARTRQHGDAFMNLLQGYESFSTQRETPVYKVGERLIHPVPAALVTVFGTDAAGVAHRYWIRTADGMLIKPNLAPPADQVLRFEAHESTRSAWTIPADLVFAGSIPQPDGQEVFFFYSKAQKVLFRQNGAGQAILDASHPTALRMDTPELANVLALEGQLLAVTVDGRVARLDARGSLNYEAVNEHWLKGRPTWWLDLPKVSGTDATLAVFGVKDRDGQSALSVWYHSGRVVVAASSLQGKPLQFVGFEDDGVTARLFEPGSGKLYLQPSMAADTLATAFGNDAVLDAAAKTPVASELTPTMQLKSVLQVENGLRLTTHSGEILLRTNKGNLQLVAVDEKWQQDNLPRLPKALAELAGQWRAKGVLTLQGKASRGWFDIDSGQMFSGNGIAATDNLDFVGVGKGEQAAYVYSSTAQVLYRVNSEGAQAWNHFTGVDRTDSSLLLQGTGGASGTDELAPPLITGIDTLVLHGGGGHDTYRLSQKAWGHYRTIVIDNEDSGLALDRLILPPNVSPDMLVSRHGDDLILTDSATGTALMIRKVLGEQAAVHRHLQIELKSNREVIDINYLAKDFAGKESLQDGLVQLSWSKQQSAKSLDEGVVFAHTKSPNLAKLSGVMAAFPDEGGSREKLPMNRQSVPSVLVPSMS
ncbi:hypothetical protein JFT86_20925 [Pseudomonas sp. TH06]|uniref:TcdA/TcdB pore-forming domain-containing protein n=1 Tax=Pseudomonas sp. TH06 TaxID=2796372 RepID=UPI0019141162|nr:TcdA/TcdB pore-forming domain-containing protein [Pseudomonas sp. TH06]MBK5529404.1 hypothetical protein [Pseudomonas sp. TH06]